MTSVKRATDVPDIAIGDLGKVLAVACDLGLQWQIIKAG